MPGPGDCHPPARPATTCPHPVISENKETVTCLSLPARLLARLPRKCGPSPPTGSCSTSRSARPCGSTDIIEHDVETGDGITEIALICEPCGCAWPVACVVEWDTPR